MPTGSAAPDVLVIGHIVADVQDGQRILGGTPAYAAHVARAFGAQTRLLTSAAADEPLLQELNFVETHCLAAEHTTTMENHYSAAGRRQVMRQVARPIDASAVPAAWRDARYVMLACMAGEIDPTIVDGFPQAKILLTAQGYFRSWDERGWVRPQPWFDETLLQAVDVVVFSEEDIRDLPGGLAQIVAVSRNVVLTRGKEGGTLYREGRTQPYGTLHLGECELTGAGDVFAACLLCALRGGLSVWQATQLAGRLAGISVTRAGMASAPRPAEISEQWGIVLGSGED
ncbi:MAG: PfkB family carbohydrate kinase [Chloroflexi bacterium]|nr:PfkB family carbohydrate kinase [Chloroflexota bacterium]